ncbi:MAG: TrmH family RNA methyltransferase [Actinomycetota bacterium]
MTLLTERSGRVREARKLLRRRGRAKVGLFLAEGPQAVGEALADTTRQPVVELFASPSAAVRWSGLVDRALEAGVPVHHAEDRALATLSETVTPQGLVAVCRSVTVGLDDAVPAGSTLVTVLAEVRDPGNAGTVIRCSDAAGADALILTAGSVDPQGGKSVRASAGSLFHLPVATEVAASDAAVALRERGLVLLAADAAARLDLDDADASGLLARPTAWVFGNEASGLGAELAGLVDEAVRIPIYGRAESLNLAAASAVCLYASARAQRRSG